MEMDMDPITNQESELIQQLREDVSDLNLKGDFDTDIFYVKWIRARNWQLDQAEDMLRKSITWRKENDIDIIHKWEPECAAIPVDYPLEVCGYNRLGCPVIIIPFCYWDIRAGVDAGLSDGMVRYIDQALELLEQVIRQRSTEERPVTQLDLIFDMNNLSFWQLASRKTVEIILEIVRRYEANHPEILHKAFVINASRIFNILFNIVKPFLSPRTLSKVNIFPAQQNQWMPALLKDCDEDQLPRYFGGTRRTSLKMYQDENRSYKYLLRSPSKNGDDENDNDVTTININPEEKVLLTFDVNVPNSKLKWEFRTDYYDIEFSVYRDGMSSDPEIPYDRFPSQLLRIQGEIICDQPGQYIAEFNNTYSEIRRAKTLHYNFQVIYPSVNGKDA